MAEQFYTILTKIGKAKIANSTALGTKVNFCKLQVGDSNGTYYNPTEDQTELKHKVWEGNINSISIDENNPNWVIIEVLLPSNVGGFMIREAAILDDEDNVVAIAKYPETYKPLTQDGSSKDILIRTILEVSNTSSVTLKVDPTVILATQKDIQIINSNMVDLSERVSKNEENITSIKSDLVDIATDIKSKDEAQDKIIKEIQNKIQFATIARDQKDADTGVFAHVEWKTNGDAVIMESTLSNKNSNGQFMEQNLTLYNPPGSSNKTQYKWKLIYDSDGELCERKLQ